MLTENGQTARVFKAFCDENRIAIIKLLQQGEMCACHLQEQLAIGQSTLSHHMRILCDAGIVDAKKEGKWMHYSLDTTGSQQALLLLQALLVQEAGR